jgi:uncharacterized BrkB/YihY/UPF0761 family membrane protein
MADLTSRSPVYNPWKLGGLTWKELTRRVWKETCEDELLGRAAQLAFYLLLALFPALLFLTALFGPFPITIQRQGQKQTLAVSHRRHHSIESVSSSGPWEHYQSSPNNEPR